MAIKTKPPKKKPPKVPGITIIIGVGKPVKKGVKK